MILQEVQGRDLSQNSIVEGLSSPTRPTEDKLIMKTQELQAKQICPLR